ncbi:MAG: potassium channel family protein [Pseudomonas sp.]|uniref:potassium channel family protein n=1 Tax=Pseudomonas sp. TaxID=306 RepID=UPI00299E8500|nr:potassium channel family protein [Pseudomonas sp.]MDX1723814.1 potassium channel family protein [Pseudomonas sp.]
MLLNLLVGLPVMLLCLVMEAIFVTLCLRYYASHYKRFKTSGRRHKTLALDILLLGMVMLLMLLGNFAQMLIWAALFMLIGEFEVFASALYHSAVNFATLGYGDIVMSERWRLLGPLEAANGILMFGVSTAVMTAAVMDVIKHNIARLQQSQQP